MEEHIQEMPSGDVGATRHRASGPPRAPPVATLEPLQTQGAGHCEEPTRAHKPKTRQATGTGRRSDPCPVPAAPSTGVPRAGRSGALMGPAGPWCIHSPSSPSWQSSFLSGCGGGCGVTVRGSAELAPPNPSILDGTSVYQLSSASAEGTSSAAFTWLLAPGVEGRDLLSPGQL